VLFFCRYALQFTLDSSASLLAVPRILDALARMRAPSQRTNNSKIPPARPLCNALIHINIFAVFGRDHQSHFTVISVIFLQLP
jgi:hypothetical protein